MPEPKTYPSEESAQRRAEQLRALGIWPGVVRHGERWRLTVDPDTAGQRRHTASEAGSRKRAGAPCCGGCS